MFFAGGALKGSFWPISALARQAETGQYLPVSQGFVSILTNYRPSLWPQRLLRAQRMRSAARSPMTTHWRHRIANGNSRHDRGIRNAQLIDPIHAVDGRPLTLHLGPF